MHYYWRDSNLYLEVHISSRAKKNQIVGRYGDRIKVQIAAPPIEGKANAELIKFFSHYFAVPQNHVQILHGSNSSKKLVVIKNPQQGLKNPIFN
jgi:uncharacterized protein